MKDPLLDAPDGAPAWLPTVDDPYRLRVLRWLLTLVFIAGVGACVVRSADNPADPVLDSSGEPLTTRAAGPLEAALGTKSIVISNPDGTVSEYCVLVADEPAERSTGLMEVTDLEGFDGMLFAFDAENSSPFYMWNTPMPLSIAWWRADGGYVSGVDMAPCIDQPAEECERYPAAGPYRWAVEVPAGGFAGATLDEQSVLTVGEPCVAT